MVLNRGDSTDLVKRFILNDEYLRFYYLSCYDLIRSDMCHVLQKTNLDNLNILELGGAGGISELTFPNIIKSDVVIAKDLELVCDATHLPIKNQRLDFIILKDSFHHLPSVNDFFSSAIQALAVGASIYIVDPNYNLLSTFIYKYFHPETFDKTDQEWVSDPSDPWHSNQALLYIVFKRDLRLFLLKYPNLIVKEIGLLSGLSYIISGGVYRRNSVNSKFLILLYRLERRLNLLKFTSISKVIRITKV